MNYTSENFFFHIYFVMTSIYLDLRYGLTRQFYIRYPTQLYYIYTIFCIDDLLSSDYANITIFNARRIIIQIQLF